MYYYSNTRILVRWPLSGDRSSPNHVGRHFKGVYHDEEQELLSAIRTEDSPPANSKMPASNRQVNSYTQGKEDDASRILPELSTVPAVVSISTTHPNPRGGTNMITMLLFIGAMQKQ